MWGEPYSLIVQICRKNQRNPTHNTLCLICSRPDTSSRYGGSGQDLEGLRTGEVIDTTGFGINRQVAHNAWNQSLLIRCSIAIQILTKKLRIMTMVRCSFDSGFLTRWCYSSVFHLSSHQLSTPGTPIRRLPGWKQDRHLENTPLHAQAHNGRRRVGTASPYGWHNKATMTTDQVVVYHHSQGYRCRLKVWECFCTVAWAWQAEVERETQRHRTPRLVWLTCSLKTSSSADGASRASSL